MRGCSFSHLLHAAFFFSLSSSPFASCHPRSLCPLLSITEGRSWADKKEREREREREREKEKSGLRRAVGLHKRYHLSIVVTVVHSRSPFNRRNFSLLSFPSWTRTPPPTNLTRCTNRLFEDSVNLRCRSPCPLCASFFFFFLPSIFFFNPFNVHDSTKSVEPQSSCVSGVSKKSCRSAMDPFFALCEFKRIPKDDSFLSLFFFSFFFFDCKYR